MFVALQFPYADVRTFLAGQTGRLRIPAWPEPEVGREFVRAFGAVRERRRGGLKNWPAEQVYCDAARAVRFDEQLARIRRLRGSNTLVKPYCAFRRLMVDGRVTVRLEVGIGFRFPEGPPGSMDSEDFKSLIGMVMHTRVRLRAADGSPRSNDLIGSRDDIARSYLRATSVSGATPDTREGWWVQGGLPLMIVEYTNDRGPTLLPENTQRVAESRKSQVSLAYCRVTTGTDHVGVWLLGRGDGADRDLLRRLRLQLFRLHAEQQSIRTVFRHVHTGRIATVRGTDEDQHLQDFLHDAVQLLRRDTYHGLPQSDILKAVQQYDEKVDPGEGVTLLQALATIRPNLLREVEAFHGLIEQRAGVLSGATVFIQEVESLTVVDQRQNIINSTVHGDVNQVAAKRIENSFNRVQESGADQALKDELQKLHEQVAAMAAKLTTEVQETVAKDLEEFTRQATAEKPNKRYLDVSKEGLLEAAKAVGEIAAPVITTVKAVLALIV